MKNVEIMEKVEISYRERVLLLLLTISSLVSDNNINWNDKFFNVLGDLIFELIFTVILVIIVYNFVSKPIYKWFVKNVK